MSKSMPQLAQIESNILPGPQLIIVFISMASALLVSFIDQNAIGIALPTIGEQLNCATTISWAGTSSLIANTVFQVLYGRLSDIIGRKKVFISAVGLLALGDLLSGFARTGPELYVFRGIAGVGTGGITALAMMIVSDIVTLENRGKYQGILGSCVGLGNAIGPFIAAGFIAKSTWRGIFWLICPLAVVSGIIVLLVLPPSKTAAGTYREKLKAIDYMGILFSSTAIMLLLIPISGGGTYFAWSSPMVISMLTLGSISMLLFLFTEKYIATYPMMPLHLFLNPPTSAILIQNFIFGIVYYSQLYFLPIYYQNARQWSPLKSAILILPFVAGQSICSILSGQYISRMKRYGEVIWAGYSMWFLGVGLILLFTRTTQPWAIVLILIVEGIGTGNVFQPTLVALQAHSSKADRAVVISVRNFLRNLGGAVGLALSSAVFSNVLKKNVATLPEDLKKSILASILRVPDLTSQTSEIKDQVLDGYMAASRGVFIVWVPLIGVCWLLTFIIKDRGLQRKEEKVEDVGEVAEAGPEGTDSQYSAEAERSQDGEKV